MGTLLLCSAARGRECCLARDRPPSATPLLRTHLSFQPRQTGHVFSIASVLKRVNTVLSFELQLCKYHCHQLLPLIPTLKRQWSSSCLSDPKLSADATSRTVLTSLKNCLASAEAQIACGCVVSSSVTCAN